MFLIVKMPETIGQQLKQARLARNLSLDQVVQATHIRAHTLAALEADEFDSIPSAVQARGFLKLYAAFLELSLDEMLTRQRDDTQDPSPSTASLSSPQPPPDPDPETEDHLPAEESDPAETPSIRFTPPVTPPASQATFNAIGATLRQRRESLSLSYEEIERHTHVRKHYLTALENGEFHLLPSSVQVRGMLANYARFIDLDVDALLMEFAGGLQAKLAERQPLPTPTLPKRSGLPFNLTLPPTLRRFLSPDILVGGSVLIILVLFAFWGTGRIIRMNAAATPQPTAPSILNILLSTSQPGQSTATSAGLSQNETATLDPLSLAQATLPSAGDGPVQVVLIANRSAWVKVTADQVVDYEGRLVAGTAYPFDANDQIEVLTGDGSAINIFYNGTNLGPLGAYGEIVDRIYTTTTILLPTITFTPSPTITLTSTLTLRPTLTPRPSTTPRP